ncbi:Hypothetical predicted protein [Paramuricea clavata]|uniref:Uncharacterized protein n=1 Tax=Paramuricea clavata TaxID=317549 RepID=A0A7D9IDJ6_PARCT|nr:Hypothetical predicted protein [Paramuricea clavata]
MNSQSKARKDLLDTIEHLIDDINEIGNENLLDHVKTLHQKVKAVFDKSKAEEETWSKTIRELKLEVSNLEGEVRKLKDRLAEAQATWIWESHVARFVISSKIKLNKFGKEKQMMDCVKKEEENGKEESYRWKRIQSAIKVEWTVAHTLLIKSIRDERNHIAHPSYIDLHEIEKSLMHDASEDERRCIKDMMNMLKLSASLMKFGRLAYDYNKNKLSLLHPCFTKEHARAIGDMATWDREFQQIQTGLQFVKPGDATYYLEEYVGHTKSSPYLEVVDAIKKVNRKRLGIVAREFELEVLNRVGKENETDISREVVEQIKKDSGEWKTFMEITQGKIWSSTHSDVLLEMKKPPEFDAGQNVAELDFETAKCLIPDFFGKSLWKSALDIIDWFGMMGPTRRYSAERKSSSKDRPVHPRKVSRRSSSAM